MKKVLLVILFLLVIGAGVAGTLIFKFKYDDSVEANTLLQQQNAQIQTQLNSIGTMTTVYSVATKCYSGTVIEEGDLLPVSVPTSALGEYSITDMSELVGKAYRVDINPGTILSKDMLMKKQDSYLKETYMREITLESLPVSTKVGDYIELRILLPNGEDIPVFTHKQIKRLYETTISIEVSEEEQAILTSAIYDASVYSDFCFIYALKYVEPGIDTDKIAYYPVQKDMENFVNFNPNIVDPTRCINTTFREHIDQVFTLYANSDNEEVSKAFIEGMKSQFENILQVHEKWNEEHTDDEGNMIEDTSYPSEGTYSVDEFNDEVGDAVDSLEDSFNQLGGM